MTFRWIMGSRSSKLTNTFPLIPWLYLALCLLIACASPSPPVLPSDVAARWQDELRAGTQAGRELRFEEGMQHLREARRLIEYLPAEDPRLVKTDRSRAALLFNDGHRTAAAAILEDTLKAQEAALGSDAPDLARTLYSLAAVYVEQARYSQAAVLLERTLEIQSRVLDGPHPAVAATLNSIAEVERGLGHYEKAEETYLEALAVCGRSGRGAALATINQNNLGLLYGRTGQVSEAERFHRQAIDLSLKLHRGPNANSSKFSRDLAKLYLEHGQVERAQDQINLSLKGIPSQFIDAHPEHRETLIVYSEILDAMGKHGDAAVQRSRANQIRSFD